MKNKDDIILKFVIHFTYFLIISVIFFMTLLLFGVGKDLEYATSYIKEYIRTVTPAVIVLPSSIFTYLLGRRYEKKAPEPPESPAFFEHRE